MPSVHVGAEQVCAFAGPEQTALWQSEYPLHALPSRHFAAQGPPQSIAGSPPLATPSRQLGAWHEPLWQTAL